MRASMAAAILMLAIGAPATAASSDTADARSALLAALDLQPRTVCAWLEPDKAALDPLRLSRAQASPGRKPFGTIDYWLLRDKHSYGEVPEPLRGRFQAALEAAVARPAEPTLPPGTDFSWFPFAPQWPDCYLLDLSAPEIEGDFAFIGLEHRCPGVCGESSIVALERRDGRWFPLAWLTLAIS
jgi:hypothetical protein